MLEAGNKRKTMKHFIYFRVSGLNQDALGYLFKLFLGGSFLDHSPHHTLGNAWICPVHSLMSTRMENHDLQNDGVNCVMFELQKGSLLKDANCKDKGKNCSLDVLLQLSTHPDGTKSFQTEGSFGFQLSQQDTNPVKIGDMQKARGELTWRKPRTLASLSYQRIKQNDVHRKLPGIS